MNASGLSAIGSLWNWNDGEETDSYLFCHPDLDATKLGPENEPGEYWKVKQKFSTKPIGESQGAFDNPFDQPPKTSGSFTRLTKKVWRDKDGAKVASSSHELYDDFEVDNSRPTVSITLTLPSLPLTTYGAMIDTVNIAVLWGVAVRCIKLSNVSWSRTYNNNYGFVYEVTFEFEISWGTFDYITWDHGTKVLKPGGTLTDPTHFNNYQDANGNLGMTLLDGSGAAVTNANSATLQTFKYYAESNFLLLGIPASL
jgi:hypothetical protein